MLNTMAKLPEESFFPQIALKQPQEKPGLAGI
jgi:hypothetical protein